MAPSPPEPDEPDWEWDAKPAWEPDAPWEPEPEASPWSEHEASRDDDDGPWGKPDWQTETETETAPGTRHRPPPLPPPVDPHGPGRGPAYLAAAALLTVLFALGLLTVGLHGRGAWSRVVLAVGAGLFLLGLGLLGLAVWLVGGLERG